MNKKILTNIFLATSLMLPILAVAADLTATINVWIGWMYLIINFLLVLATLVFIWGIVKYVSAGGDAAKITEARTYIIWGLVGLAVMGSVWVITRYLIGVFAGTGEPQNPIPKYTP